MEDERRRRRRKRTPGTERDGTRGEYENQAARLSLLLSEGRAPETKAEKGEEEAGGLTASDLSSLAFPAGLRATTTLFANRAPPRDPPTPDRADSHPVTRLAEDRR